MPREVTMINKLYQFVSDFGVWLAEALKLMSKLANVVIFILLNASCLRFLS